MGPTVLEDIDVSQTKEDHFETSLVKSLLLKILCTGSSNWLFPDFLLLSRGLVSVLVYSYK